MTHDLLARLVCIGLALGASACSALNPLIAPSAHQCPWIDVEPSALTGAERQEMRARVTAPGVDYAFQLALERTADSLVLVGLTPLGTKSFEVERRGKRVRAANHLGLVSVVPPRNVLADITGILAAGGCSESPTPEATAELGRWTLTDTCANGRPVRRHVRGPGEVGNVDITYGDGEITVVQHDCNYEARYVRLGAATAAVSSTAAPSAAARARPVPGHAEVTTAKQEQAPETLPAPRVAAPEPPRPAPRSETPVPAAEPEPARVDETVAAAESEATRADETPRQSNAQPATAMEDERRPATAIGASARIRDIVEDLDRSDDDLALDAGRKPDQLLAFLEVEPGMRVAELGAGGGYTAELLARSVGARGTVYAQNSRFILERFADKPWSERLTKPIMRRVVRVDREFTEPLPPEVRDLDLVVMNLFYHDTVWMKADRERMNRAILRALRPGGRYVVIDHSARKGRGLSEVETLHRIEESVVRGEIVRAGFRVGREADFLRNPADTRDWNDSPRAAAERRGTSDRFVIEFVKPSKR